MLTDVYCTCDYHAYPCMSLLLPVFACRSGGHMWSRLWQLAYYLRCGTSGMDSAFLKKAEIMRRRARKLNWQQTLALMVTL